MKNVSPHRNAAQQTIRLSFPCPTDLNFSIEIIEKLIRSLRYPMATATLLPK